MLVILRATFPMLTLCSCQVFIICATMLNMSGLLASYEESTKPAVAKVSEGSAERRRTSVKQRREKRGDNRINANEGR